MFSLSVSAAPAGPNKARFTCANVAFRSISDLQLRVALPTTYEFPLWQIFDAVEDIQCDEGKVPPFGHRRELCNGNGIAVGQTREFDCVAASARRDLDGTPATMGRD